MSATDRLRALYGPGVPELRAGLPDLADGLHAQLLAVHGAPSESVCEDVARNLHGAAAHVLRLADAIRRETANDAA